MKATVVEKGEGGDKMFLHKCNQVVLWYKIIPLDTRKYREGETVFQPVIEEGCCFMPNLSYLYFYLPFCPDALHISLGHVHHKFFH